MVNTLKELVSKGCLLLDGSMLHIDCGIKDTLNNLKSSGIKENRRFIVSAKYGFMGTTKKEFEKIVREWGFTSKIVCLHDWYNWCYGLEDKEEMLLLKMLNEAIYQLNKDLEEVGTIA